MHCQLARPLEASLEEIAVLQQESVADWRASLGWADEGLDLIPAQHIDAEEDAESDGDEADEDGHTALHWACDAGHMEVARCLLEHGAAPNAQNVDGSTPLHMACACEHLPRPGRLPMATAKEGKRRRGEGCGE